MRLYLSGEQQRTEQYSSRPEWLKVRIGGYGKYKDVLGSLRSKELHTVCEEAKCPNRGECWAEGTATFLILGDICTRSCRFCAVKKGHPHSLSIEEPQRVAEAVKQMGLWYVVITSVTRDDLPDGGASVFADVVRCIRTHVPQCRVEVLIPDFAGNCAALDHVLDARPDVLSHNIETVPRLYPTIRPQAHYERSLMILERAKNKGFTTKTGLMVGLGEESSEVIDAMRDARAVGCDVFTIGQYLQPTNTQVPVTRFVHPREFQHWKEYGKAMGFLHVESAPLVRSSYHAARMM